MHARTQGQQQCRTANNRGCETFGCMHVHMHGTHACVTCVLALRMAMPDIGRMPATAAHMHAKTGHVAVSSQLQAPTARVATNCSVQWPPPDLVVSAAYAWVLSPAAAFTAFIPLLALALLPPSTLFFSNTTTLACGSSAASTCDSSYAALRPARPLPITATVGGAMLAAGSDSDLGGAVEGGNVEDGSRLIGSEHSASTAATEPANANALQARHCLLFIEGGIGSGLRTSWLLLRTAAASKLVSENLEIRSNQDRKLREGQASKKPVCSRELRVSEMEAQTEQLLSGPLI